MSLLTQTDGFSLLNKDGCGQVSQSILTSTVKRSGGYTSKVGLLYQLSIISAIKVGLISNNLRECELTIQRDSSDIVKDKIFGGGETQNRTGDTRIFSPLLYRLSYFAESPKGTNMQISVFWSMDKEAVDIARQTSECL